MLQLKIRTKSLSPKSKSTTNKSAKSNNIPYLEYADFQKIYPTNLEEAPFAAGNYGEIFLSKQIYAVKVFQEDKQLEDLIKELNIYSKYIHPCILKPLAWTVLNDRSYLAFPKCKNITQAYKDDNLSIEQVIFDSFSAIEFLNSNGVVHADIKPSNMLYDEEDKTCKTIDMGLARKADLDINNEYYTRDVMYTPQFKDPELYAGQYNSITTEIFSLIASLIYIILEEEERETDLTGMVYNKNLIIEDVNKEVKIELPFALKHPAKTLILNIKQKKDLKKIKWLIDIAKDSLDERPLMSEILKKIMLDYKFTPYKGIIIKEDTFNPYYLDKLPALLTLTFLYNNHHAKVETIFLWLQIVNRTSREIMSSYEGDNLVGYLQVFLSVAMNFAMIVNFEEETKSIANWSGLYLAGKDIDFEETYKEIIIKILRATNGVISTITYRDYARNKEDLLILLRELINCRYDKFLDISNILGNKDKDTYKDKNKNKCITVKDLITKEEISKLNRKEELSFDLNLTLSLEFKEVNPCVLDKTKDVKYIIEAWNRIDRLKIFQKELKEKQLREKEERKQNRNSDEEYSSSDSEEENLSYYEKERRRLETPEERKIREKEDAEYSKNIKNFDTMNLIEPLLHNKSKLYLLDIDIAWKIFDYKDQIGIREPLIEHVLDTICIFNWRDMKEYKRYKEENLHPFAVNEEEIEE